MGEYSHYHHHHDPEDEEEEEALSLCDLPLHDDDNNNNNHNAKTTASQTRRSSSEPPDLFEFFSDPNSEMCLADDIIFGGKLIPFQWEHQSSKQQVQRPISLRRRSESLSELQSSVTRSDSTKSCSLMRNSRSLDYRRLERYSSNTSKSSSSESDTFDRNSSVRSVGKSGDSVVKKTVKPRWYALIFGVVNPPTEMELSDIKSRQFRRSRNSTLLPPPLGAGKKLPATGTPSKGSSKLLRVLSCKDHASVAVATSFYVPQV